MLVLKQCMEKQKHIQPLQKAFKNSYVSLFKKLLNSKKPKSKIKTFTLLYLFLTSKFF